MEEITLFQEKKISEIKLDIYGVPDLSNWPQIFEIQNTAQKCYYTIKQHEEDCINRPLSRAETARPAPGCNIGRI